jgi:hypothetical protein
LGELNLKCAVGLLVVPEGPESLVVSGARAEREALPAVLGAENSEVSPLEASRFTDGAVAVSVCPTGTLVLVEKVNEALPEASVLTIDFWPMNFLPSFPLGLEKNSMV